MRAPGRETPPAHLEDLPGLAGCGECVVPGEWKEGETKRREREIKIKRER